MDSIQAFTELVKSHPDGQLEAGMRTDFSYSELRLVCKHTLSSGKSCWFLVGALRFPDSDLDTIRDIAKSIREGRPVTALPENIVFVKRDMEHEFFQMERQMERARRFVKSAAMVCDVGRSKWGVDFSPDDWLKRVISHEPSEFLFTMLDVLPECKDAEFAGKLREFIYTHINQRWDMAMSIHCQTQL